MLQPIVKLLGALGGGAVIFYALGFTIVQTYIYKNSLEGMFWLTKEFYIDAGSKFLLEMVRAPLLTPLIFLIYVAGLFLFLIPKKENLQALILKKPKEKSKTKSKGKLIFAYKQWIKLSCLLLLVVGTYFFALCYDKVLKSETFLKIIDLFIINPINPTNPTDQSNLPLQHSLFFFGMVAPVVVALGIFMYRFHGVLKPGSLSKIFYHSACIISLAFLAIIPIAYGLHLYDWKMVLIKDPQIIESILTKKKQRTSSIKIWLLGQFGDKYLFFKKEGADLEGVLLFIDKEKINYLDFNALKSDSLRELVTQEKEPNQKFINDAKQSLNKSLIKKGEKN